MSELFQPLAIGDLELPNRIVMAPLTRCRAGVERVPNRMMAEYYVQRAEAGLIISEATSVSPQGVGYHGTPGIWSMEQVDGWRLVTEEVHKADGRIFVQLWHVGRISDPRLLDGKRPVAPSEVRAAGHVRLLRPIRTYVVPRALDTIEIPGVVQDFRRGAEHAKEAGFDGVEIHAANGYLIDQFLQDSTNKRTDRYGGSVENRARFILEIVDAIAEVWSPDRIGVHLRPRGEEHDMGDSNPKAIFEYVAEKLSERRVGFLFVREIEADDSLLSQLKKIFKGPVICNELMSMTDGARLIKARSADAIAFGRDYIANPDLVERLRKGVKLNVPDPSTFFAGGRNGYTDYPFLREMAQ